MCWLINLLLSMLFYCDGSLAVRFTANRPRPTPPGQFVIPHGESRHAHYRDPIKDHK